MNALAKEMMSTKPLLTHGEGSGGECVRDVKSFLKPFSTFSGVNKKVIPATFFIHTLCGCDYTAQGEELAHL